MERLPLSAAVKSPYPRVVSVVKLKYWNVWVLAGSLSGEEVRRAQVVHGREAGREHQPDDDVGAQGAVNALDRDRALGQHPAHNHDHGHQQDQRLPQILGRLSVRGAGQRCQERHGGADHGGRSDDQRPRRRQRRIAQGYQQDEGEQEDLHLGGQLRAAERGKQVGTDEKQQQQAVAAATICRPGLGGGAGSFSLACVGHASDHHLGSRRAPPRTGDPCGGVLSEGQTSPKGAYRCASSSPARASPA